ncbi:MAG TPA: hypothetical protein VJZ93_00790 [Candidatus Nanoarchaeia archaeon]|nr:hypothetical protein [Candidatus Nanoarchaeia archaeon]
MKSIEKTKTGKEIVHLENNGDALKIKEGDIVKLVDVSINNDRFSGPLLGISLSESGVGALYFLVRNEDKISSFFAVDRIWRVDNDGRFEVCFRDEIGKYETTHPNYQEYLKMLEEAGV